MMGNLTRANRDNGAVARLNYVGVYLFGGDREGKRNEFLAAGTMQWQEGPAHPVGIRNFCPVVITSTSFLTIAGQDIWEFDAAIAGPTNSAGWREAARWPRLKTYRSSMGCAKIGQKVIIAGDELVDRGTLTSTRTVVLDLTSRRITSEGDMAAPRYNFHAATILSGGREKMFTLAGVGNLAGLGKAGGSASFTAVNTVEEWVEANSTWKAAASLVVRRGEAFAVAVVPRQLICPGV